MESRWISSLYTCRTEHARVRELLYLANTFHAFCGIVKSAGLSSSHHSNVWKYEKHKHHSELIVFFDDSFIFFNNSFFLSASFPIHDCNNQPLFNLVFITAIFNLDLTMDSDSDFAVYRRSSVKYARMKDKTIRKLREEIIQRDDEISRLTKELQWYVTFIIINFTF